MNKMILVSLACMVVSSSAQAAPKPKVTICHFDEESDTFVKLSLAQNAADKHLAKHDDGLPDGLTAESQTQLDANCAEVGVVADPAL